jgi:hypothetical protein
MMDLRNILELFNISLMDIYTEREWNSFTSL